MKRSPKRGRRREMFAEYDFVAAVRGKYFRRYQASTNVVVLDSDVSGMVRTSRSVNDTLRGLGKRAADHELGR